jgi:hypothetical protein
MIETLKGQVQLYACGGGGLNIGQRLEKHRGKREVGFAALDIAYIDTSRSNLRDSIKSENGYLLEGLDGSGKVRSENHQEIGNNTRAVLQQFKPADLNIVLSTAAGGSGSVIAPLIVSELLAQDKAVVVIAVGSAASQLDADNSLKTLKSYEAIAKKREAPVVMYYVQNSATCTREQADVAACQAIMALCLLFSRENRELDSRDLYNFLRFSSKVSSFPPQLACLSLVEHTNDLSKLDLGNVISVATLAQDGSDTQLTPVPQYQTVGFLPPHVEPDVLNRMPMHFITSDGLLMNVAKNFSQLLGDLQEANTARLQQRGGKGMLERHDVATDDGLVL